MGALAQALLCADYLEPGRPFLDREERARILARDLAGMTRAVIERKLAWVAKPARATRQLYEELARHA
jgi:HD superfamily phosphohydrolase YqeK